MPEPVEDFLVIEIGKHTEKFEAWILLQDNGEKFTSLLNAISAYAEGFSANRIIRRAFSLWEKLETR